jgi:hypothetical protein
LAQSPPSIQNRFIMSKPISPSQTLSTQSPVSVSQLDIRESIRRDLPDWLQPLLTRIIAKPYIGEPATERSALQELSGALSNVVFGLTVSTSGVLLGSVAMLLIPLGWFFTLHGTHKLHLTIRHSCAHDAMFDRTWQNNLLGEFISILTLTVDYARYKTRHLKDHHPPQGLLRPNDGTYDGLILELGLKPGASVQQLRWHVWSQFLSPVFHTQQLLRRFKRCFYSSSRLHNLVAVTVWGTVITITALTQSWLPFLVSWVLPMTVPFNLLLTLRLLVEHRWPHPSSDNNRRSRQVQGRMTAAVFFADPTPQFEPDASRFERVCRWGLWWAKFLLYHLPARALVLPGDAPCHDYHHRHPASKDWPNASSARQQDLEAGCPGWPEPYLEVWGLLAAIGIVLESLSLQPGKNAAKAA